MSTTEKTFHGYIETTRDSLIILEACRRGLLPRINRRLQEKERQLVQSGAVFCFDENESGIKRWTDGLVWSPSRILGNFLVYRELDKRAPQNDSVRTCQNVSERQRERALVGSLTNSYRFKRNGLIKKSMSIVVNGVQQHLISYYSKDDVMNDRLQTPSNIPALATLEVSPDLLLRQNFRIPLFLDVAPPSPTKSQRLRHQQKRTASPPPPPHNSASSTTSSMTSTSSSPSPSPLSPLFPTEKRKDDIIELNLERSALRQKRRFMPMQQQQQQQQQPRNYRGYSTSSISSVSSITSPTTSISSNVTPSPTQPTTTPAPDGCICGRSKAAQAAAAVQREQQRQSNELNVAQRSTRHHSTSANITTYGTTQPQVQPSTVKQPTVSQQPAQQISRDDNPGDFNVSYGVGTSFPPMGGPAGLYSSYHLDRQDQNPHQHLFYSTSLHAVNHSAIPMRSEVISNAFMLDPNYLLGSGWNDFEMQL